jgi:hypothetical protein
LPFKVRFNMESQRQTNRRRKQLSENVADGGTDDKAAVVKPKVEKPVVEKPAVEKPPVVAKVAQVRSSWSGNVWREIG